MLGVRGCAARQGILFANFSCLCSLRYAFQAHSKLSVPSGYTISRFLYGILCSLRVRVR